jgi:hypothetical protein
MKAETFENFPCWIVVTSNAVGLGIYAIGFSLMMRLGTVWGALYATYCVWMEWRLLSGSCPQCYYFGKRCGFGKGVISAWFFTKKERPLGAKRLTWRDLAPDFLVSFIPLAVGIATLFRSFSWLALISVVVLAFLASVGTGFVRGALACKFCKQRELGCPAEQLFSKTKKADYSIPQK